MAGAEVQTTPVAEPDPGAPARIGLGCLPGQLWDPSYRRALAWVAPLVVLAYGFAMTNFTLAGDDWFALYPQATLDTHYSLVAGRWMMPVTWWIMGNGSFVPFFTFAVALVLLVLAGLIACATWGFRRSWAVLAVVALFVVNPMFTDTLSFKQHHLSFTIGLVCATAAGWVLLRWRGGRMWRVVAAATLLVVSLASYQPTALAFAVVVVGGEVLQILSQGRGYWGEARWRWLEVAAATVAGVAVYLLSVRIVWWATGTDPLTVEGALPADRGVSVDGRGDRECAALRVADDGAVLVRWYHAVPARPQAGESRVGGGRDPGSHAGGRPGRVENPVGRPRRPDLDAAPVPRLAGGPLRRAVHA